MSEATGQAGCDLTAEGMTAWINDYFAACNSGDVDRIAAYFEPDGVHYFPPGMYAGPFRGAHDISDEAGWMPESSDQALGVALGIQLRE